MIQKIAFLTDIHLGEDYPAEHNVNTIENWSRILTDLHAKNIENIIFGGDIGSSAAHDYFFESLKPFDLQLVLGNHDSFDQVSKYFNPVGCMDELYFYRDIKSSRMIFMDSSSEEISERQLKWLNTTLYTDLPVILFIHHPVLQLPFYIDKLAPLKNREQIQSILQNYGRPVKIFCGHYHMNDQRKVNNIEQIITHASSFQIRKLKEEISIENSTFGYRLIKLDASIINSEIIYMKKYL